jgi:hypothetical protein
VTAKVVVLFERVSFGRQAGLTASGSRSQPTPRLPYCVAGPSPNLSSRHSCARPSRAALPPEGMPVPDAGRPARGLVRAVHVVLSVIALVLTAGPAAACLVCIALPERTLADRVIEAEARCPRPRGPRAGPSPIAPVAAAEGRGPRSRRSPASSTARPAAASPPIPTPRCSLPTTPTGWTRLGHAGPSHRGARSRRSSPPHPPGGRARPTTPARFAFFAARHDHPDLGRPRSSPSPRSPRPLRPDPHHDPAARPGRDRGGLMRDPKMGGYLGADPHPLPRPVG